MSDADIAKNLLLGKDLFQVVKNNSSIKFFMRYTKENKIICENFLKQINKFVTELYNGKRYWYYFDYPYGDSIMLFEIRSNNGEAMNSIQGRWELFESFANLKKE